MNYWDQYLLPNSIDQALAMLRDGKSAAKVIAGGTDLLLDILQQRHPEVETLIDISKIPEMRLIERENDRIFVGAAATHNQIVADNILQQNAQCLIEASSLIGGHQVRNVATIGGNVAHALPAADGSIALLALNAEAEIASQDSRRWLALEDLFLGPRKPAFDTASEILVRFRFPVLKASESTIFRRVMRPQGVAIAILNMATWMRRSQEGSIEDIRLAIGPAGPKPLRARKTEESLRGKEINESTLADAVEALLKETSLRTSPHRATRAYRQHLLSVLLGRQFEHAGQKRGR